MGSRVYGLSKLRRKLARIEPKVGGKIGTEIQRVAEAVKWQAVADAPREYGDLQASIDYVLSRDKLTAVIGPGVKAVNIKQSRGGSAFAINDRKGRTISLSETNKALYFQFLKGYWLEFGTKGHNGSGAIRPRPFMRPAWDKNANWAKANVHNAVRRALEEAAR